MRISILLPNLAGGGVERVRLLLAEEFLACGYDVDFVLMRQEGALLAEVPSGCQIVNLQTARLRQVWFSLHQFLRKERPDVLLAAMWPLSAIAGMAIRTSRTNTTLVVSEHNDFRYARALTKPRDKWILKRFGRFLYAPANGIVAVSQGVAESLVEVAGLDASSIKVIYNPIRGYNGSQFPSVEDSLITWWNEGNSKLLSVGSLKEQKSFDILLQAFAKLRESSDVRLIILGEGHLRPSLENIIRQLDLEDAVQLPGFRSDPFPYYESSDVFVLSSSWEGFGIVIAEALSCGVPVISTNCPSGPSEILENGLYGRLVPVGDVAALTCAIKKTLTDDHDRTALKKRASDFNPKSVADQYLSLMFSNEKNGQSSIPRAMNVQEA